VAGGSTLLALSAGMFSFCSIMTVYLAAFGFILFVLLFGESEVFEGTVVETCHWLVSDGLCAGSSWALRKALGKTMGGRVEKVCNGPNPAMQLVYVWLVMGGYWTFCVHAYDLLGLYMSSLHRVLLPALMLASIASWLATCWSDPGAVTSHNLDAHLEAYPFDYVLYVPKPCPTLGFTCPARSKFCRVTRRRVARFDHFCGWMNNAIGENNLRYFVSFLAMHVVLTGYGSWLCFCIVYGELTRRGLWGVAFEGAGGAPVTMTQDWPLMTRFCMFHFGPIVMLGVFLAILVIMLGAFLGYHVWMIRDGVTTNETFKWKDHRRRVLRAAHAAATGEDEGQGEGEADGDSEDDERDVGCVGTASFSVGNDDGKEKAKQLKKQKTRAAAADGAWAATGVEQKYGKGGGVLSWIPFARRLRLHRVLGGGDIAKASPRAPKVDVPPTRNLYDKGFRQNIAEVFSPPSRRAARELAERATASTAATSSSRQRKGQRKGKGEGERR